MYTTRPYFQYFYLVFVSRWRSLRTELALAVARARRPPWLATAARPAAAAMAAAAAAAAGWEALAGSTPGGPLAGPPGHAAGVEGHVLELAAVAGVAAPAGSDKFQLRLSLYHPETKTFYGRTWESEPAAWPAAAEGAAAVALPAAKKLYLAASVVSSGCVVVAEAVAVAGEAKTTVGWGTLPLAAGAGPAPLFPGTPRYLAFNPPPAADLAIAGCTADYSVAPHAPSQCESHLAADGQLLDVTLGPPAGSVAPADAAAAAAPAATATAEAEATVAGEAAAAATVGVVAAAANDDPAVQDQSARIAALEAQLQKQTEATTAAKQELAAAQAAEANRPEPEPEPAPQPETETMATDMDSAPWVVSERDAVKKDVLRLSAELQVRHRLSLAFPLLSSRRRCLSLRRCSGRRPPSTCSRPSWTRPSSSASGCSTTWSAPTAPF